MRLAAILALATAPTGAASWQTIDLGPTTARWYRPDSAPAGQALPAIVFLHGSGSSPEAWLPHLDHLAESQGVVLLLPRALSPWGFGVDDDRTTIRAALERLAELVDLDPQRLSIAGHSSGGAYAYVLALGSRERFSAVFSLSAPFRVVLERADRRYATPVRLYYGEDDPNFAILPPLGDQLDRLGVRWELESRPGYGHSSRPPTTLPDGFDFLLSHRYALSGPCVPARHRLCLRDGRFAVEVDWRDRRGRRGRGTAVEGDADTAGHFWFFSEDNLEMLVKVIDGCAMTRHFWVFAASATNVEYRLRVIDVVAGEEAAYDHPLGPPAPAIADTSALATCP